MSRSPTTPEGLAQVNRADSSYRRQIDELNRRLNAGESLSGRERNCAFLNMGTAKDGNTIPRSATVSAISGFDFADDGRGLALVDWDGDGDLDVWLANRTAPQIRFLRNDLSESRSWLALRLEGVSSNRDAIGAVVKVTTDQRVYTKSLRAGEGYLSQSSKSLHFGLGDAAAVRQVAIRWPGGKRQVYESLPLNRFYHLREDEIAKEMARQPAVWPQPVRSFELPDEPATRSVVLTSPLAMPPLTMTGLDVPESQAEIRHETHWTLLNLWASWCEPCRRELTAFKEAADVFESAGITVVALSVDGLAPGKAGESTLDDARRFRRDLDANYAVALATPETVDRLQWAMDYLFGQNLPLGVPTSFVIDARGRIAAVYAGPVTAVQLVADMATASLSESRRVVAALPFPGRWIDGRRRPAPLVLAADLASRAQFPDASDYVKENWDDLMLEASLPDFAGQLGNALMSRNAAEEGFALLAKALETYPKHVPLMNNYAYHLATHADRRYRDGNLALRWATQAAEATQYRAAPVLDTLAAAYAEAGRFDEAVQALDQAIRLTQDPAQRRSLESAKSRYANRQRP